MSVPGEKRKFGSRHRSAVESARKLLSKYPDRICAAVKKRVLKVLHGDPSFSRGFRQKRSPVGANGDHERKLARIQKGQVGHRHYSLTMLSGAQPSGYPVGPREFLADICSGEGGVARALRKKHVQAREFEKMHGGHGDVTRLHVLKQIRQCAVLGSLSGAMLAPPCTTCSRALNWTGHLRSKEHPWGLPALRGDRSRKVEEANKVIRAIITIIRICDQYRIPWIVENPLGSALWWIPFFVILLQRKHVQWTVADYCRFGRRWRKRTCFLSGHVSNNNLRRLDKRCQGTGGFCPHNAGRKHMLLEGYSANGRARTSLAQAYPPQLCDALAHALYNPLR